MRRLSTARVQKLTSGRELRKPRWNGPLIGRQPEGYDTYLARMRDLLRQSSTHIYFDASFLLWLAKIDARGREEFRDWENRVGQERFHVPLWAAHEFFKHRLKGSTTSELTAPIKSFDRAACELYAKLVLYRSDELFGFERSGDLFVDEFRRAVQPLRAMLRLAEKSDHFGIGIDQVSTYIDGRLLPGPLAEILADIESDERVRNRGVVPPSFNDAHKRGGARSGDANEPTPAKDAEKRGGDNSFGDLVFWREVLKHAAESRAKNVVIMTADRKNDWFENQHGDAGLTPEVRKRVLYPRPVPAPHPLLSREAFDVGAGELSLIDPMYFGLLLEGMGQPCRSLASAALDGTLPQITTKTVGGRSWAGRFGAEARLLGTKNDEDSSKEQDAPFDPKLLKPSLLRTKPPKGPRGDAIITLYQGSLADRAAVFAFLTDDALLDWEILELVALGKAAVAAAEAGDPRASSFLSHIRDDGPELGAAVRESIGYGALASLYFDDDLQLKPSQGHGVVSILLDLSLMPEAKAAADAVAELLEKSGAKVPYLPGRNDPISIEVTTRPSANNKSPADLIGVKVEGQSLTTPLQTDESLRFTSLLGRPSGEADMQVGAVLEILSRHYRLPKQLMTPDTSTDAVVRVSEYAGVEDKN